MSKVFDKSVWGTRLKVLLYSGIFASLGNWLNTYLTHVRKGTDISTVIDPIEIAPTLISMFFIVVIGYVLDDLIRGTIGWKLPSIIYISLLTVFFSVPDLTPFGNFMLAEYGQISLLPLCTPILAYAGIAIGKDLEDFKKQGLAIMVVACLTFIGTYVGSALIAHVVLSMQGVI